MSCQHKFAFCSDAVCVAEDAAVSFYAPKTLKKYHVERLNNVRLAGLTIAKDHKGTPCLHVVDATGNWFVVSLNGGSTSVVSSTTINLPEPTNEKVAAKCKGGIGRRSGAAHRTDKAASAHGDAAVAPPKARTGIAEAHFTVTEEYRVTCVFLYGCTVFEMAASDLAAGLDPKPIMVLPRGTGGSYVVAVGRRTGLVVAGEAGARWLQYCTRHARGVGTDTTQKALPVDLQSLDCSPSSMSVAIGGSRGELVVYPSVLESHYFSDHWHHTPLTAIAFSPDGNAVFTGAREATLLVWNTASSYSFKKIGCGLGAINGIIPSISDGTQLLLPCAESTLAVMDLLQMRPVASLEGIQWARDSTFNRLIVDRWSGQPAVILTGLPDVVRICDPVTQQALYSLHVSTQLETVPSPPRCGILHVGLLDDGKTIVTYEEYAAMALPSALRFWAHDAAVSRHTQTQTIYSPHNSGLLALHVDKKRRRLFTMSSCAMKTWCEGKGDPNDAYNVNQRRLWENETAEPTPTLLVQTMILSGDGSTCAVADDTVYLYGVSCLQPASAWPLLAKLTQSVSTAPLRDLQLLDSQHVVVARDEAHVFFWSLADVAADGHGECSNVWRASQSEGVDSEDLAADTVAALCTFSPASVLVSLQVGGSTGVFVQLSAAVSSRLGEEMGRAVTATCSGIMYMVLMQSGSHSSAKIAVVDSTCGFRMLNVQIAATLNAGKRLSATSEALPVELDSSGARNVQATAATQPDSEKRSLRSYFRDAPLEGGSSVSSADGVSMLKHTALATAARKWLADILDGSPYAAPPMSSVLSQYLDMSNGTTQF